MAPPRPERPPVDADVPARPANPATGVYSPPGFCPRTVPGKPPRTRPRAWASNPRALAHGPPRPPARCIPARCTPPYSARFAPACLGLGRPGFASVIGRFSGVYRYLPAASWNSASPRLSLPSCCSCVCCYKIFFLKNSYTETNRGEDEFRDPRHNPDIHPADFRDFRRPDNGIHRRRVLQLPTTPNKGNGLQSLYPRTIDYCHNAPQCPQIGNNPSGSWADSGQ